MDVPPLTPGVYTNPYPPPPYPHGQQANGQHDAAQASAGAASSQNSPGPDATSSNGRKRKASTAPGSRGVANLTPEQLSKKRANDREAQRAIRERTKNTIDGLERRIRELESQQPFQELQQAIRERDDALRECELLREKLAQVAHVVNGGPSAGGTMEGGVPHPHPHAPSLLNELAALTALQSPLPPLGQMYDPPIHPPDPRPTAPPGTYASPVSTAATPGDIYDGEESELGRWSPRLEPLHYQPQPNSTSYEQQNYMPEAKRHARWSSIGIPQHAQPRQSGKASTILDIPNMMHAFESMPEAMKTYVMYQFLRCCAKPTLRKIASVVNPALKCDPFNVLPPEIGLNITRYLDAHSMCRAAQVCKKWRRLINSDETAWKDLLDRDEFVLPEGEIARAVREGWGWQNPGEHGSEEDLGRTLRNLSPESLASETHSTNVSDDEETASPTVLAKAKRKSTNKHPSSKRTKWRGSNGSSNKSAAAITPWQRMFAIAQGPLAYATAAAEAVPSPSIGLPSLKNMHLFKSLYQRHYLIRKAWMAEDPAPHHFAFRAHHRHRHVVTCLLFDADKIITGSDDTKINVYDTKTGALRTRLDGHEGGVWALQYEGNTLVSGSTDRSVRVWDIKAGRCLQVFQGHTSTVRCLVILQPVQIGMEQDGVTPIMMPKEPLIITGSRDSTLRVWRLPQPGDKPIFQAGPPANDRDNPYYLRTLSGHHNSVRAIAAHGDTLVSGSYDCTVRVWKISTGDILHRLQGHSQKVYSVVLDQVRNRCISGSMDNLVKVWDLTTGACLFTLEGHTSLVGLLDLSHDRLVSAAADSTLRIWDPESGTCKTTLSAHTGAITCFQHDGQKVISGSDRTLKMWNVKSGECVRDLLKDLSGVWQVRFDERRCVAAVQRHNLTYIEVMDFGASRDGIPAHQRGRRIVVDTFGKELLDAEVVAPEEPEDDAAA